MVVSDREYRASERKVTIYNSLGGSKAVLEPLDPSTESPAVKMYVCGNTPQDHSHLGHGMTALRFDIVRRYLSYRRLKVNFIQNVTDIDDKIIDKELTTGVDPMEMTRRFTEEFYECLGKLRVLPVDKLTKVTEYVPEIIRFIEKLIAQGFAYATPDGSVYFDVAKKSDYGKLSNQNTEMLYESVRKELDKQKHSPLDFALWKHDEKSSLSRPSPWGIGRPGWHIECSVMIHETLGDRIDIHGGGLDLKFPHHENEIAQSEAYSGETMANFWMHAGLLNINGQKMSKSLNNFVKLVDGIDRFGTAILRFVVARHHYRSSIDLTDKLFHDNLNSLLDFHKLFARIDGVGSAESRDDIAAEMVSSFEQAMDNDFNSPEALVALEKARSAVVQRVDSGKAGIADVAPMVRLIRELGNVLGLFFDSLEDVENQGLKLVSAVRQTEPLTREEIAELIRERTEARQNKNFARGDEVRAALAARGVEILDSKTGTSWRFA